MSSGRDAARGSAERVRLFVALELPESTREALARWRSKELRSLQGVRLIAPADLHVTLCFLGWRTEAEIDPIAAACRSIAVCPSPELTLGDSLWLPPRRPRVLAVELDDARLTLGHTQAALSTALQHGGWYVPEKRPFLAHVTVARMAKGARPPRTPLGPPPAHTVHASLVTLYRSQLHPGGARYEPLASVALG